MSVSELATQRKLSEFSSRDVMLVSGPIIERLIYAPAGCGVETNYRTADTHTSHPRGSHAIMILLSQIAGCSCM
jgi:hypothetical protein